MSMSGAVNAVNDTANRERPGLSGAGRRPDVTPSAAPAYRARPPGSARGGPAACRWRCGAAVAAANVDPVAMADAEDGEEPCALLASHAGGAGSKAGGDKMFSLKKWNAVAMWSWDVECDTCAICRVQVMGKRAPGAPGPGPGPAKGPWVEAPACS